MTASPTSAAHPAQNPALGIGLMLFAILLFTGMDATAKSLVAHYPAPQVVWIRFLGQFLLAALILRGRTPALLRTAHPGLHVLRALTQVLRRRCRRRRPRRGCAATLRAATRTHE